MPVEFRRGSSGMSSKHAPSFDQNDIKRRQSSVKYQFPTFTFDEEEEALLFNSDNVREEDVRRAVFGPPINELIITHIDTSVTRPTTASSRRSVLWSRERKAYEEKSEKRMREFQSENYMQKKYPEIRRHWPGTWRTVNTRDLDNIVNRLSRPTVASSNRAKSAPLLHRRVRTPQTQQWCKYYCIDRCKHENYVPWAPSPVSESSWPQSITRDLYSSYSNHSENRIS